MSKMASCLTLSAIVTAASGCCATAHVAFEPPPPPVYREYTEALWQQIPREAQEIIVHDQLAVDEYVDKVESRAAIHNSE